MCSTKLARFHTVNLEYVEARIGLYIIFHVSLYVIFQFGGALWGFSNVKYALWLRKGLLEDSSSSCPGTTINARTANVTKLVSYNIISNTKCYNYNLAKLFLALVKKREVVFAKLVFTIT